MSEGVRTETGRVEHCASSHTLPQWAYVEQPEQEVGASDRESHARPDFGALKGVPAMRCPAMIRCHRAKEEHACFFG
jgi:hypothetical protein